MPGTLSVTAAPLTVTAASPSKVYGAALPALSYTTSPLVNGDTVATALIGALSTTATATSPVGGYPISRGTLAAANYSITFVPGTLAVTAAPLTVTASSPSKVYGAALPTLTYTTSPLVNGDTVATALTGTLSTTATAASPVANYPISRGTLAAANYTITFVPGTLAVTPAPITVTADNKTKTVGAANPPLTFTAASFVNGDTVSSLTTQPTLSTTATTSSTVGSYPITVSGAVDPNYTITYVSSTLTVTATGTAITATLSSTASPAVVGRQVTLVAVVNPAAGGAGGTAPTGPVTFMDGNTVLGTSGLIVVSNRKVTMFSTSSLAAKTHSITAMYAGGGKYAGSATNALVEKVNKVATSTALVNSTSSPVTGQSVPLTATITVTAPGGGIASGSVTFKDGRAALGTGSTAVVGGKLQAIFTTSSLAVGTHSITAVYGGDANYAKSTSTAVSEAVGKRSTNTSLSPSANPVTSGQPVIVGGHSINTVDAGSGGIHGSTSSTLAETATASHVVNAAVNVLDVNYDGAATPADALVIISRLKSRSTPTAAVLAARDVNYDGQVSPLDALMSINYLKDPAVPQATAASTAAPAAVSAPTSTETIAFALSRAPALESSSTREQSSDAVFANYPSSND